jgi:hypothetical protein
MTTTTYCQRHPDVESELRCGRCETLICPRCLVYTPAGVRCPDCAQLRRPPMYELGASHILKATGAAFGLAIAIGAASAFLLPNFRGGFFLFILGALAGSGLAGAIVAAMTWATNGKRGATMQAIACASVASAGLVRIALTGEIDLMTLIVVGFGAVVAWQRLQ